MIRQKKYQYYIFDASRGYVRQYSYFEEVYVKIFRSKWPQYMKFTVCMYEQIHMYIHKCHIEKRRERKLESKCGKGFIKDKSCKGFIGVLVLLFLLQLLCKFVIISK